ncbi:MULTISPECIES: helix-turn-helix transcriptional regulator [unclassified Streptomyces]|uniref:helix-turn-helix transcriptional regulator n=1 Tax=unclassified Streptomyces TaxID=2593676 RepID=UPI0038244B57
MSTTRPMLTQREAAAACGVSRTTIRRRREDGDLPGAVQDPKRGWIIPVDDLLAAGFRLHAPTPPDAPATQAGETGHDQERADVAALRSELAAAEYGRRLAEAEAGHLRDQLAARGEHIADLQKALAALMPAPERVELTGPTVPAQGTVPATSAVPPDGQQHGDRPKRRWWGGRR